MPNRYRAADDGRVATPQTKTFGAFRDGSRVALASSSLCCPQARQRRGCYVTGNEYLFVLFSFLAAQQLASAAATAADEGRSWMQSLGVTEFEDLVWLRAL